LNEPTITQPVLFADLADRPVIAAFDQPHASSDGGAILLKAAERRLGLLTALAATVGDALASARVTHGVADLVAQRVFAIADRLITRRIQQARFRDTDRALDTFDLDFNKKMNRALIHELATGRFILQGEDVLLLGPPGTGMSHLAQALGRAAIHQGHRVLYREAHILLEETRGRARSTARARISWWSSPRCRCSSSMISACTSCRTRPLRTCSRSTCAATSAPRRCSRRTGPSMTWASDWGKLLGDTAAITALLDRLLHHAHLLKCRPRSWRTKVHTDLRAETATQ